MTHHPGAPHWVIMPYRNNLIQTKDAVDDVLKQDVPGGVRLLLINNGGDETVPRYDDARILHWKYTPGLSLAAVWNLALEMVWESGGTHAWVVNNDVRLHPSTYQLLLMYLRDEQALFVSANGVTWPEYQAFCRSWPMQPPAITRQYLAGPDFSCFVIAKACHVQFAFDPAYHPAYCEDLDYHRRLMLEGMGDRIFGTGFPFAHLHQGSGTIRSLTPEQRVKLEEAIDRGSRVHHVVKWGGPANQERKIHPWSQEDLDGVGTGQLFERVRRGQGVLEGVQGV